VFTSGRRNTGASSENSYRKISLEGVHKMKVRNLRFKWMACVVLAVSIPLVVYAATAIATVGPNTPAPNIQYGGGCSNPFILATNNAFVRSKLGFGFNPNVSVQFTPLVGAAGCVSYQINPQGIWHLVVRDPNGNPSQFQVTDNANGNVLLRGRFDGAILHGRDGTSSLALTLMQDNVLYDAANSPLLGWFGPENGSLSIAILARNPVPAGANGPAAFLANGDINFGAFD
jgi:hypothetical protein